MEDAAAGDSTDAEAAPQALGPYTPPALEQAFNTLVDAGLGPRQLRTVEALFTEAIDQLLANVVAHHPRDLAAMARHLYHLRGEPITQARSLMGEHNGAA